MTASFYSLSYSHEIGENRVSEQRRQSPRIEPRVTWIRGRLTPEKISVYAAASLKRVRYLSATSSIVGTAISLWNIS